MGQFKYFMTYNKYNSKQNFKVKRAGATPPPCPMDNTSPREAQSLLIQVALKT
jgi:hypothetical protein